MRNKIQRTSFFLRIIFQILFISWPIFGVVFWMLVPTLSSKTVQSIFAKNFEILHQITRMDALWGFLIESMSITIVMTVLYFLIKLCKLWEQDKIFILDNAKYFKNIGVTMLIGNVVSFVRRALMSFALTYHNPVGHKTMFMSFGSDDVFQILIALTVIIISWILAEAYKLEEEQKSTI